jgi:GDP-mannose transporter
VKKMKGTNRQFSTSKLDTLASRALSKLTTGKSNGLSAVPLTQTQSAVLSAFAYSSMSISMVLANKLVLTTYNFEFPNVLLLLQCFTALGCVFLGKRLGLVEVDRIEVKKMLQWLPVNVFFLMMLLSGFYSLKLLSVPMLLVFKNSNNVLVTYGDWLFFGQPVSRMIIVSLVLLVLATLLSAHEDLEFNLMGYLWTFVNMISSTGYVLYLRHAMTKTRLSQIGMVVHNNLLSIPLVIIADIVTKNDISRCIASLDSYALWYDPWFLSLFLFNGVVGSLLSLASFFCVQSTSPTTFSMVGALNKVPLVFIGIQLFGAKLTVMGTLYVTLSLCSGALYGLAKVKQSQPSKQESLESPSKMLHSSSELDLEDARTIDSMDSAETSDSTSVGSA